MTWRAALLAVVALALHASSALAGTVAIDGGMVTFRAAPDEANAASAEHEPGQFVVYDSAAAPTAGAGCRQRNPSEVQCPDAGISSVLFELGNGDDIASVASFPDLPGVDVTIHGGPGNDSLSGTGHVFGDDGADKLVADDATGAILDGGPGDDQLRDGEAADQLFGGEGDDELSGHDGDLLVGGPGYDELETGFGAQVTIDCEGRDDDAVQPLTKAILRNCLPAPVFTVRVPRISVKRFVRSGVPIDVSCEHPCAVALFLRPGTCPYHGTGTTLSHRAIPRTRFGFIKARGAKTHWVGIAAGQASRKAISRVKRCKASLEVSTYSQDGLSTTRKLAIRIG
jgi:hypothetical protein